ncbi:MAG: 2Fe-2S iron-sulfur cluster binding domain-containing protein [Deltaproteobacteria bacterium]|nr:2Fe-2S iron-sulfur cluster binding domain-containing protein [Deltaproteobacteria bacterium]MBW1960294.1 2Fe-2S iron-sulfur cluster binding domain-containing protein [Deltaproteobacteria bacterium]MBW2150191.1 2Fe-2S iron-sulfur cluster binding domain-containing protein [Deltaproteobacteria bacterium]
MNRTLTVRCAVPSAHNSENWEFRQYDIEIEGESSVMDVLKKLYQQKDHDIVFYSYCRQGLCAGCRVEVNGRRVLACQTLAESGIEIKPVLDD